MLLLFSGPPSNPCNRVAVKRLNLPWGVHKLIPINLSQSEPHLRCPKCCLMSINWFFNDLFADSALKFESYQTTKNELLYLEIKQILWLLQLDWWSNQLEFFCLQLMGTWNFFRQISFSSWSHSKVIRGWLFHLHSK